MFNEYIEKLVGESDLYHLTTAQAKLVRNYRRSKRDGYEFLVVGEPISEEFADDFVFELMAAGISEIYYISESSNYLDSFLAFQKAGAKIVEMVEIENGNYKKDMKRWGFSEWNQFVTAIKWQIA